MHLRKYVYKTGSATQTQTLSIRKERRFVSFLKLYVFEFGLRLVGCAATAATLVMVMAMVMVDPVAMVTPGTAGGSRHSRGQPKVEQEQQSSV
jgi:hypothetical protein